MNAATARSASDLPSRRRARPARKTHLGARSHWWIALVVVALFATYFWYTSARRLKVAVQADYGPLSATFPDTVGPLLGADFSPGNSVQTLINGDQFFPAMLAAIRGAQKTITLETYIWAPGKISDEFIAALSERARAGVKVHVLMDGMGTLKFRHEDRVRMQSAGIELLIYGREHWYDIKPNISHRTHRKLLIVDGRIGFTGGMCIDDHWMGNADSPKVWRETQVRVEGPVVRQMQAVFASNWLQTTARLLQGEDYFPKTGTPGTSLAQCIKSGPGEGTENARLSYFCAIAAARKTIDIGNAYFVPDDLAVTMLIAARQRGVRVRIVVPAINDSRFGRAVSRSRWGPLLAAGVEFYEYLPAMYHAKTMVVDNVLVTVGSANFDNRSFTINDEVALNVIDRAVAAVHEKALEDDMRRSHPLSYEEFQARPWYIKLADMFCGLFRSQF
ncbi:MAG TPA: phospholipase D-like domain-containing protein [Opitutaceae bacterium]|nr:phospholipase D-like domain-containing protein [Opitutaceae bacterium]